MRTTPIEQTLIDALVQRGIKCEPQKPVGWQDGHCQSLYPCKYGMPWQDSDTDEWDEGDPSDGFELPDCEWLSDGYYQYYIDIFIPIGPGLAVEVDDFASHSTPTQIAADVHREQEIKRALKCAFQLPQSITTPLNVRRI